MVGISKELILAILGSTVISGIINTIFNYFQKDKDNRINNISSERTLWRNTIREIAEELSSNELTISKFDTIIVRLKIRINPLEVQKINDISESSIFNKNKWVEKNGYITEILDEIQKKRIDTNEMAEFYDLRNLLIDRISLLLKLDWERSKREIVGEVRDKIFILFTFIYTTCFILLIYINTFYSYTNNITTTNLFLIFGLLFPFVLRVFIYINLGDFVKIYLMYFFINVLYVFLAWLLFFQTKGNAGVNLLFLVAMLSNVVSSSVNMISKHQEDRLYKDVLGVILKRVGLDINLLEENDFMINKSLKDILKQRGILTEGISNIYLETFYIDYLKKKFDNRVSLLKWLIAVIFMDIFSVLYFVTQDKPNIMIVIGVFIFSLVIIYYRIMRNKDKYKDMYVMDELLELDLKKIENAPADQSTLDK